MRRIIDAHTHVFPDAVAGKAIPMIASESGVPARYDGTVAGLLEAMERSGVSASLVAPVATKPSQVPGINDWVISLLGDDRLIPFGAMHPEFEDPGAEIERLARAGVRGIKLHSMQQFFHPQEERLGAIYGPAMAHGLIILFHAGGYLVTCGPDVGPADFAVMLDRWPGMTCIIAHMGGYYRWHEVEEHLVGRDCYFDTSSTPGHLADEDFLRIARAHGVEKVLFGSDGPWADVAVDAARIAGMGFTEDELDAIFEGNARRLFKMTDLSW